jgi:hypothetical protein
MPELLTLMKKKFNQDVVEVLSVITYQSNYRPLRSDELQLQGILRVMLSLSNLL